MSKNSSMISSMTGFGRGDVSRSGYHAVFELSSVNSRYLEISVRLPRWLLGLEGSLRGQIEKRLSRGKVFGQLNWERTDFAPTQTFNEPLASWYIQTLEGVGRKHNLNGSVTLSDLLRVPELWTSQSESADDVVESILREALDQALDQLVDARRAEGKALADDLRARVRSIEVSLQQIQSLAQTVPAAIRDKLTARVQELFSQSGFEPQRLAQEVAYMAERADITEECVRLIVHMRSFLDALDGGDAVGRRLNFLTQEMNREANTIASKSVSSEISTLAVSVKEELERIREQVQNIE